MSAAAAPERAILAFHQDDEGHWVAELECGHNQHVRHSPPWQNRPWVVTEAGRAAALGRTLPCRKCEQGAPGDDQPARFRADSLSRHR